MWVAGGFYNMWVANAFKGMGGWWVLSYVDGQCFYNMWVAMLFRRLGGLTRPIDGWGARPDQAPQPTIGRVRPPILLKSIATSIGHPHYKTRQAPILLKALATHILCNPYVSKAALYYSASFWTSSFGVRHHYCKGLTACAADP